MEDVCLFPHIMTTYKIPSLRTLRNAAHELDLDRYDFVPPLLRDIRHHLMDYEVAGPIRFFQELLEHGCQSGMISMFIYNDDCKRFYIRHIDSMEQFLMDCEDEYGICLLNPSGLPHYTLLCWFCYEQLANRLAALLYPTQF